MICIARYISLVIVQKKNILMKNLIKQHGLVYILIGKEKTELIDFVSKDARFEYYSLKDYGESY